MVVPPSSHPVGRSFSVPICRLLAINQRLRSQERSCADQSDEGDRLLRLWSAQSRLDQIEKPVPKDDEMLVRVRAASVNPYDWHFVEGTPYVMRAMGVGLRKPKDTRLGVDFAGTVEAVGKNVTQLQTRRRCVRWKRRGVCRVRVSSRHGGNRAKTGERNIRTSRCSKHCRNHRVAGNSGQRKSSAGQKVLMNGASGGVGTFAVQIAKSFGANVTGVCSTRNVDLVKSLGADHVIDYTKEDFTKGAERYDVILDNVGDRSLLV